MKYIKAIIYIVQIGLVVVLTIGSVMCLRDGKIDYATYWLVLAVFASRKKFISN